MMNAGCNVGRRGLIFVPMWMMLGCAATSQGAADSEVLVRARAYWAAMLSNDLTESWRYEEVSKDPRWTLQNYIKRAQVTYDAIEVLRVLSVNEAEAVVEVKVRYSVPTLRVKGLEGVMQDVWKKLDGQWYHAVPKNAIAPGGGQAPAPSDAKKDGGSSPLAPEKMPKS